MNAVPGSQEKEGLRKDGEGRRWPRVTQRGTDRTQSKGPRDSCGPPPAPPCSFFPVSFILHLLSSFSSVYLPTESNTFWAPVCARPRLEEGCCDEDGSLSHAGKSSLVSRRGSHGDGEQRSVGVRMGEICQEREASSAWRGCGASSRVGVCGCRQEMGRAEAEGPHQARPQEPLRSRASVSQGTR